MFVFVLFTCFNIIGTTRFVFFTNDSSHEKGRQSGFDALHRSNKRAIESVASVLRIEIEDDHVTLLDVIIDPAEGP